MDWKTLTEQAQKGNADAWGQIFEHTQSMVYFTCVKLIHNTEAAQDIAQEVYINAMEHIASLEQAEAFPGWIKRIAVNLSKNYLVKKRPTLFSEDEDESFYQNIAEVNEDFLPEEYAQRKETCRIITGIVDSLPEKQRVCVMLYYFDELSVLEIAQIMGVSENTVKSRLNYARAAIKKEVEALEKKGTKLHCAALPVLALILRNASTEYTLPPAVAAAVTAGFSGTAATASAATMSAASGTAVSAASSAGAAAASATAASSAGLLAKIGALPLLMKIIAGVLAGTVGIGGIAAAVTSADKPEKADKNPGTSSAVDFFGQSIKKENNHGKADTQASLQDKNREVREQLENYWIDNCKTANSRYFFADITHDGIDELFSVNIDEPYADYTVYMMTDSGAVNLFTDGSASMTNWMYSHYLLAIEGKVYIVRSGYFGRQGYPLIMYEVFNLDQNGEKVFYREESYEGQQAFDKEQDVYKIINEYEKDGLMLIGFEDIDLAFGKWTQQTLDIMIEQSK